VTLIHETLLLAALISFVALPLALSQTPSSADNKTAEQEVRQMIEQYRTALTKRDTAALERIWADDYTFINASGAVVTKAERLANLKSGATSLDTIVNGPRHENPGLRRRCSGRNQSGHAERAIQRQSHQWPIPSSIVLGKNAVRLATGLQPDYSVTSP
jgi:hypothetical protein